MLRSSLLDQLAHWDKVSGRMYQDNSPQDLLIEFLHKKMEQDSELNRILIASTERMIKLQADAQIQAASMLKVAAKNLRNIAGDKGDMNCLNSEAENSTSDESLTSKSNLTVS